MKLGRILYLALALLLTACATQPTPTPTATITPSPVLTLTPSITPTREATPWPTLTPRPAVGAWAGQIYSAGGGLYDDFIRLINQPTRVEYGLASRMPETEAEIATLRDTEKIVQVTGVLVCGVPDYGGCRIDVTRLYDIDAGALPPPLQEWRGTIHSAEVGSGFDDYFRLATDPDAAYGIASADPDVAAQIESYRDTGTVLKLVGGLLCPAADYGDCQIDVIALEVERFPTPAPALQAFVGTLHTAEAGMPADDYMYVIADLPYQYGIDAEAPDVQAQLAAYRDSGAMVQIIGSLTCGVADAGNCRIMAVHVQPFEAGTPVPQFEWFEGTVRAAAESAQAELVISDGFAERTFALIAETADAEAAIAVARERGSPVRVAGWKRCGIPELETCEVVALYVETPEGN